MTIKEKLTMVQYTKMKLNKHNIPPNRTQRVTNEIKMNNNLRIKYRNN